MLRRLGMLAGRRATSAAAASTSSSSSTVLCASSVSLHHNSKKALSSASAASKEPLRVAVTGPAGNIGYALLFRIASGALFGPDQPVILHCVEIPPALNALKGVAMELEDCAFPLLKGIVQTADLNEGFDGVDYAMLVGSKPRGPGMERADLLNENGKIFTAQGKALNASAKKTVKVVVVGNPANTNCLIAASNAPDIPRENFSAMTRLDHNRAVAQVANKTGASVESIEKLAIWGNHSPTMYPDLTHCTINGEPALQVINDDAWVKNTFIPDVQQRGKAIIDARGASSAASAGNGAIDHIHDWALGTGDKWVSSAVPSDGSYGIEEGVFFSYPVTHDGQGNYSIVQGLDIDEFSAEKIEVTKAELFEERDLVSHLI